MQDESTDDVVQMRNRDLEAQRSQIIYPALHQLRRIHLTPQSGLLTFCFQTETTQEAGTSKLTPKKMPLATSLHFLWPLNQNPLVGAVFPKT